MIIGYLSFIVMNIKKMIQFPVIVVVKVFMIYQMMVVYIHQITL